MSVKWKSRAYEDSNLCLHAIQVAEESGTDKPIHGGKLTKPPCYQINNQGLTTYSSRTSVPTTFLIQRGIIIR